MPEVGGMCVGFWRERSWKNKVNMFRLVNAAIAASLIITGCSVYYYDSKNGTEHIIGFGHLEQRITRPEDGKQAAIKRATLSGIVLGIDENSIFFCVGWDKLERLTIYNDNTYINILRPANDNIFEFKIGTYPSNTIPLYLNYSSNKKGDSGE